MKVSRIRINNFKSIRELDLPLNKINVLIGPNGAGKSNFVQFFDLLGNMISQNLRKYVAKNDGADNLLFFGRKHSEFFSCNISFEERAWYEFELAGTVENKLYFNKEIVWHQERIKDEPDELNIATGNMETNLDELRMTKSYINSVVQMIYSIGNLKSYHFHDTSFSARVKGDGDVHDNRHFRGDASNLAAYLYLLQENFNDYFLRIENTVKLIAPFFQKFNLEPSALNNDKIRLEWKHVGMDEYFDATRFSDGTLRFICLITLLLQPKPPDTIIIDEPELGLHPAALELLSSLIKSLAAKDKQIICATHSVTFLNHFEPEDIIVVDRNNGESIFRHLDRNSLTDWLNEYAIGELWEKNVLGGRP